MTSQGRQLLGSLLVAVVIVTIAIVVVTARLGPTSAAELESIEDRQKERIELREERREARQEALEEARERR
jgi:hypothetical protein